MSSLTAPLAKAQGVLSVPSTLPAFLVAGARPALVWVHLDFGADALRLWRCQSFGARPAPLSRVRRFALVLPAGAPPHLPSVQRTGHKRVEHLLLRDKRPKTLNRGRAGWDRCHRHTGASAAKAAWGRTLRSHDKIATIWWYAWELRSGCRPYLQRCASDGLSTSLEPEDPHLCRSVSANPCRRAFRCRSSCPARQSHAPCAHARSCDAL